MTHHTLIRRPRWARPTPAAAMMMLFALLTACSDGCDCAGFEARDFPVEHYDKTVPNTGQVRLTASGLGFIGDNIAPLVDQAVPGGLSFCIPKDTASDTKLCFENVSNNTQQICDDGSEGCQLNLTLDTAQIVPKPSQTLEINATIGNLTQTIPFETSVAVIGTVKCDITLYKKGTARPPAGMSGIPGTISAKVPVSFPIDNAAPLKDMRVEIGEIGLDLDDLDFSLRGNLKCGTANVLKSLFRGTIESLVEDQLQTVVADITRQNLCQACGPDAAGAICPERSTCSDDGVCEYDNSNECVPRILGIEGGLVFDQILTDFAEENGAEVDVSLRAADYAEADTGFNVSLRAGFQNNQISDCVPVDPTQRPEFNPIGISQTIKSETKPNGQPFMVGIGLHKSMFEQALWTSWASGGTCLAIGPETSEFLNTNTFELIVKSLKDLDDDEKRPVRIKITPQNAPELKLGANTVVNGKVVEGLLTLDWKDLDIHIYAHLQDRETRLFTIRGDMLLPVAIEPDQGQSLRVVVGELDNALQNIRILNNVLPREPDSRLQEAIPTLLGIVLPQLAGSLDTLAFDLPEFFGLRLKLEQGDITSVDNNTFVALFASLEQAPPATTLVQISTELGQVEVEYPEDAGQSEGLVHPTVKVDVSGVLDGQPAQNMEYSWRLDNGLWSPFTSTSTLVLRKPVLALPGDHNLDVRARIKGQLDTLDPSPASTIIHVDYTAPTLKIAKTDSQFVFKAYDLGDKSETLRFRHRVHHNGTLSEWSQWSAESTLETNTLGLTKRARMEVQVKDPAGRVTTTQRTFNPKALMNTSNSAAPKAGGCSQGSGSNPTGPLGTLMFLGMGLFALGRRKRAFGLVAGLVGILSMGSGCGEDPASNECDPECPSGQQCKDNACVSTAIACTSDIQCAEGQACINDVCTAVECKENSDCDSECTQQAGVCTQGVCSCEDYCVEGCGDGESCCYASNSCKTTPTACDGQTCEEGFEPKIINEGTSNPNTCTIDGGVCECVELPPLTLGYNGRFADLDEFNGVRVVSAYNQTYGDLVFGVLDANLDVTWQFVDGAPSSGTIAGKLTGPRGGISDKGDHVGTHTALTLDGVGVAHVFYRDEDNKTLKYARGTAAGEDFTFVTQSVDTNGDAGLWTQAMFDGTNVHAIYTVKTDSAVELRHLQFDPSVAPDALGTPEVILTSGAEQMAIGDAKGTPLMTGVNMSLAPTSDGMILTFYDGTQKSVGWMLWNGSQWSMPEYVSSTSGPFGSAIMDASGNIHVAYMNNDLNALMFETIAASRAPEVIVDGVRSTVGQWIKATIGHGVVLRLDASGVPEVVFQDTTLHSFHRAKRQGGTWTVETLGASVDGSPVAGHGFYADMIQHDGQTIAVEYVIRNKEKEPIGEAVFYAVP